MEIRLRVFVKSDFKNRILCHHIQSNVHGSQIQTITSPVIQQGPLITLSKAVPSLNSYHTKTHINASLFSVSFFFFYSTITTGPARTITLTKAVSSQSLLHLISGSGLLAIGPLTARGTVALATRAAEFLLSTGEGHRGGSDAG